MRRVPLVQTIMAGIETHRESIRRNKRCVLAYLHARILKIKELYWQSGNANIPDNFKQLLSPSSEVVFWEGYKDILQKYSNEMGVNLLLDQQPPQDLYITVKVLKDCGEISTETGNVRLDKHTVHLLRRTDCELLIKQGFLEHLSARDT